MHFFRLSFYFLLLGAFCSSVLCYNGYYWRDYTGEIPIDAVNGGQDKNNKTTYIGQVYVKNSGIIPVNIYPGITTVIANIDGLHKTDTYVKILCSGTPWKFKWVPTTAGKILQSDKKNLVPGGVEYGLTTHIGRVWYQSEVIVAKICSFTEHNAEGKLFFPGKHKEQSVHSYEALVYE